MGGRGATSGVGSLGSPTAQRDYPPAEEDALRRYTRLSSINPLLGRKGYDGLSDSNKELVQNLDKAIARTGFNKDYIAGDSFKFSRGASGRSIGVPKDQDFNNAQELADYINNNLVGKPSINKGYTSITQDSSVSNNFASSHKNAVVLEYAKISKGVRGAYLSGGNGKAAISHYGSRERETLLQRNLKTTPISAWVDSNGTVHVAVFCNI